MTRSTERRLQRVRAAIDRLGLRVEQIGNGSAVRIRGAGIDLTAAAMEYVELADIRRAMPDAIET